MRDHQGLQKAFQTQVVLLLFHKLFPRNGERTASGHSCWSRDLLVGMQEDSHCTSNARSKTQHTPWGVWEGVSPESSGKSLWKQVQRQQGRLWVAGLRLVPRDPLLIIPA